MRSSLRKNSSWILNKYWPPTLEIIVDRTSTKTFPRVSGETDPVLVRRILGNERINIHKKLLTVRPKTAPGKKKQKKERIATAKRFVLHANAKR